MERETHKVYVEVKRQREKEKDKYSTGVRRINKKYRRLVWYKVNRGIWRSSYTGLKYRTEIERATEQMILKKKVRERV